MIESDLDTTKEPRSRLANQPVQPGAVDNFNTDRTFSFNRETLFYTILFAISVTMRLWDLDTRSFHHDESLHAFYSWNMSTGNGYVHNPMMHGPFQFHLNSFIFFLFGDNDFTARLTYALFGVALVATPLGFRSLLGKYGAMASAVLLSFSPTLLYFSRFARNDIIMAFLIVAIVMCVWSYLRSQHQKYLYSLAALLALAFATKETIFIIAAILGVFLLIIARTDFRVLHPWKHSLANLSPAGTILLILGTLGATQISAFAGLVQNLSGVTLINSNPDIGPIGAPVPDGELIAITISLVTVAIAIMIGLLWNWRKWLICFTIFSTIWILLHTNFLSNVDGLASGGWQSLGYWIIQQDVGRGGQPWYYYFVLGSTYELVSLAIGITASVWYLFRGNTFSRFLVFWSIASFVLFTVASEKMPWLLVQMIIPLILLAGKAIGDLLSVTSFNKILSLQILGGIAIVPVTIILTYRTIFYFHIGSTPIDVLIAVGTVLGLLSLGCLAWILIGYQHRVNRPVVIALTVIAILFLGQFRAAWISSYQNGDNPKEMLVYTQSSADIPKIVSDIHELSRKTADPYNLPIIVDSRDGFAWPWVWYLRHYRNVQYIDFQTSPIPSVPNPSIFLIHAENLKEFRMNVDVDDSRFLRYQHRAWFPETYREITLPVLANNVIDRSAWTRTIAYWLHRDFETPTGSADAFFYSPAKDDPP